MSLRVGQRVTNQPPKWWDGTPVEGWPREDMTGIVVEHCRSRHGDNRWVYVKWNTGRRELESIADLVPVP